MSTEKLQKAAELFKQNFHNAVAEIKKVIVGYDETIENIMIALISGGHVLLEGVPGLGKTLMVRTLSKVINQHFSRIQFTPDLMPADITGTNIVMEDDAGKRFFQFQKGPLFGNIILADEINRATPRTQSAMLEAMQESSVTVAGERYALPQPFFVMATQNPIEMEGTYPLPEAQLDRFIFKLTISSPINASLVEIFNRTTQLEEPSVNEILEGSEIIMMRSLARNIPVANPLVEYVARLIRATHPDSDEAKKIPVVEKYVRFGASPRGGQSIILAAKVRALIHDRFNVSGDDIRALAKCSLRHRIIMNFEGEAKGFHQDDIIDELIRKVPELPKMPV